MSTALAKPELAPEPATLSGLLKLPQYSSRFSEVLKERAPQFISSILQEGRALGLDCEPKSIIGSSMIAAALNLPINRNLGFAWLVPYKVKGVKMAQFQMGYKGYVQLALRTGQYSRLNVCKVYEGEFQNLDKLTGDLSIDATKRTSEKVVGYASYIRLVSGFEHAEYWDMQTVKDHAQRYSQSYKSGYDSPWKTHFDEMAMKTVLSMHIRRWGPMSIDVHKAYQADNAVVADVDAEPEYVDNAPAETQKPDLTDITVNAENKKVILDYAGKTSSTLSDNQNALVHSLDSNDIDHAVFANWLNVNGHDKKLGFDASGLDDGNTITNWPEDACLLLVNDKELMSRAILRFGNKK